jgi:hypothetical protein
LQGRGRLVEAVTIARAAVAVEGGAIAAAPASRLATGVSARHPGQRGQGQRQQKVSGRRATRSESIKRDGETEVPDHAERHPLTMNA